MPKPQFHPLRVADVEPLTDDSVAITFEVPPELADAYRFTHGQHLTIPGTTASDVASPSARPRARRDSRSG